MSQGEIVTERGETGTKSTDTDSFPLRNRDYSNKRHESECTGSQRVIVNAT